MVVFLAGSNALQGQTRLMNTLVVTNKTNFSTQVFESNASASQSQGFTFPSSIGTAGQIITVSSAGTLSISTSWSSGGSASAASLSNVVVGISDGNATTSTINVATSAGTYYRFEGEFTMYRNSAANPGYSIGAEVRNGAGNADNGGAVALIVECVNCPCPVGASLPFVSTTASAGPTVSVTPTTNATNCPDLAVSSNTPNRYRVSGTVFSSAGGSIVFIFNKSGGATTSFIEEGYWTFVAVNSQ